MSDDSLERPGPGPTEFGHLWDIAMETAFSRPPMTQDSSSKGDAERLAAVLKPESLLAKRYRLQKEIGEGGMGTVLLARDGTMERDVALKRIRPEFSANEKARARFIREAVIAGQLQHPGVVPIYELGEDENGNVFLTMRPVAGKTFAVLLRTRRSPEDNLMGSLRILEQVCQTMAYAHTQGVIHRDLKPDNIMVGAFGEVQVLDWGLAKVLSPQGKASVSDLGDPSPVRLSPAQNNLSIAGSVLGTPMYMAPEQALGDLAAIDERTDVFSLGAILCEILTGEPLYSDPDPTSTVTRAAKADLASVYARLDKSSADPELKALAKECLHAAKTGRPRNAAAVADRLSAYLSGIAERARQAEVRAAARRRTRRLFMALAGAVLLLVAGGVAFLWHRVEAGRNLVRDVEKTLADALDRASRQDWTGAEEIAARAQAMAAKGGVERDLQSQIGEKLAKFRESRRQQELRDRIDQVRLTPPGPPEELDDAYRRIFAEAGIDMTGPTAKVAHAIVAQSEALRATFITALDTWASRLPHDRPELAESWTNLIETASAADIDPWRNRLRRAMLRRDRETIEEMANGLDAAAHAPESILLLGQGLHIVRIGRPAEIRVLLEGFRHHPGDFWINFTIVHLSLTDPEPGNALELAERHARIAVALRPDNFDAWGMLGAALLLGRKDLEEAKFAFRTALEKTKIRGPREHLRAALLMAEGKPEEGRRILDELPDAGPPWFRRLSGRPDGPDRPPRPDRDRPPPPDRR